MIQNERTHAWAWPKGASPVWPEDEPNFGSDLICLKAYAGGVQQQHRQGGDEDAEEHANNAQGQDTTDVPTSPALHCHVRQPVPSLPRCLHNTSPKSTSSTDLRICLDACKFWR